LYGIHGSVFVAENNLKGGKIAVKIHHNPEPFQREFAVYERLQETGITKILEFNVPQLIHADTKLLAIEMTIVTRPFVLDFAGAYLDAAPRFSDEIWTDWEIEKKEQFGDRWTTVLAVLAELEMWDIHMIDVSPSNIAFNT